MPLLSLWQSNPDAITSLSIEQIVGTAGDGGPRDGFECSNRAARLPLPSHERPAGRLCRTLPDLPVQKSGMVLQDVINELGRRLEYSVTNGLYQGTTNAIGFDGLWQAPEGNSIVVEVKTTDAYRISLDTLSTYRMKLRDAGKVGSKSSMLVIVGSKDAGKLEAQVRGSRHAWEMGLISTDSLVSLVKPRESTDSPVAGAKLRSVWCRWSTLSSTASLISCHRAPKDVEEGEDTKPPLDDDDGDAGSPSRTSPLPDSDAGQARGNPQHLRSGKQ